MTIVENQQNLLDELNLFPDWTEKYEYIIDLGKKLTPLQESLKTDDKLIKGCQSRVWLHAEFNDGKITFQADSDSVITKGLIALFVRILSGYTPEEILNADIFFVPKAGLTAHLAPTRANALHLMEQKMKEYATEWAKQPN